MLKPLSLISGQLALLKNNGHGPSRALEGHAECIVVVGEQSGGR
jgi:hypothetical protein